MFFTLLPSLKLPATLLGTGRQGRSGNPRIPHLLRCRGFAVCGYSFTLDALDLPDSGIYEQDPRRLQRESPFRVTLVQKRCWV